MRSDGGSLALAPARGADYCPDTDGLNLPTTNIHYTASGSVSAPILPRIFSSGVRVALSFNLSGTVSSTTTTLFQTTTKSCSGTNGESSTCPSYKPLSASS